MPVLVNNLQDRISVDQELTDLLAGVVQESLRETGANESAEVSLVFVDDSYMAGLNKQYRGIDGPTDVLSFSMLEGQEMPGDEEEPLLGDIVISLETAERQAEEYGHSLAREVAYLTVHGVLHLLGYDHETEQDKHNMRGREEAILARLALTR